MSIIRVPVTVTSPQAGGPFMNILHFRVDGVDEEEADNLGEALTALEDFYTAMVALYPAQSVIRFGEGMIRDPLGSPTYVTDDPKVINVGSTSQVVVSTLLAVVVGWRTTSASRSGRGRTFIGPLNSDATQGDGTPLNGAVSTITAAAQALAADSQTANGWALGVLSTKQGLLRDVTGASVKDRWAFLSSRRD